MSHVDRMLREIEMEAQYARAWTGKPTLNPEVIDAMRYVPRDQFVPESAREFAYENGPLSIGYGQTISQPFIVALMTDLLKPNPNSIVLEVGAGSGYQAAVLSLLVRQVYSIEIVPELASRAARLLKKLDFRNVEVRQGDGYFGWPEHAPYDGIIVTAAAPMIPPQLLRQLRPDANLVIPIGLPMCHQELMVVRKKPNGEIATRTILSVAFVPLTGSHDQADQNDATSRDPDHAVDKARDQEF